jgi:hypothetical protein
MCRSVCARALATTVFVLLSVVEGIAINPDPRLLPLIPPNALLVAGMSAPSGYSQPDSFLLLTRNNSVDLADFLGLTGVDPTRLLHQVIFVAAGSAQEGVHSLLVSGQFDRDRIFKAAISNGASVIEYRGLPVLVRPPFAREQSTMNENRWLVVLQPSVAIFGSEASVREEVDRSLAASVTDISLTRRLDRLNPRDETWCLIAAINDSAEIRHSLQAFDPSLPGLLHEGDAFQFGIQYGKHVAIEYEVTSASPASLSFISDRLSKSFQGGAAENSDVGQHVRATEKDGSVRGVVKVPRSRYEAWLLEVSARSNDLRSHPIH